jgi:anti-repressor protein
VNEIQIFENAEFGQVRTVVIDNEPWFVGKDIATILGYKDTSDALKKHVDEEDKLTRRFADSGQNREMYIINESGLYALVFGSKLPSAKRFKHWVTSEVLPTIRKTGGYRVPMSREELMALALKEADKALAEKNQQISEMKPKALFAEAVSASHTSILVGDLAKLIKQNGYDIGQKRLFAWLRDNGWLIKSGASKNMPTQKGMERKYFEVKESTINNPDGSIRVTKTTKVTGKGQVYFVNKFLAGKAS